MTGRRAIACLESEEMNSNGEENRPPAPGCSRYASRTFLPPTHAQAPPINTPPDEMHVVGTRYTSADVPCTPTPSLYASERPNACKHVSLCRRFKLPATKASSKRTFARSSAAGEIIRQAVGVRLIICRPALGRVSMKGGSGRHHLLKPDLQVI